jgi:hypothetical protein
VIRLDSFFDLGPEVWQHELERAREHPEGWSIQGFGMLRLYLGEGKRFRLHVWSPELARPRVTTIHDHPWHFRSKIVSGVLRQRRFSVATREQGFPYVMQTIRCGPDMCVRGAEEPVGLLPHEIETYRAGAIYTQKADEVHESYPGKGCVTIVDREFLPDEDHARVFWKEGAEFISAEPRPAERWEVKKAINDALWAWGKHRA